MSGYTCWMEHGKHKEVVLEDIDVGDVDDVDQMNHCWTEQNMVGEDTDVGGDDDVDQMNHCWTEQNMAGEDTDVGGDDNVQYLDEMLQNVGSDFSGKSQNDKFSQIMKDYKISLLLGCKKEHNKSHIVLTLLQMKASNS
jgi:hypothetical protein